MALTAVKKAISLLVLVAIGRLFAQTDAKTFVFDG
jgi:hypothetical protein